MRGGCHDCDNLAFGELSDLGLHVAVEPGHVGEELAHFGGIVPAESGGESTVLDVSSKHDGTSPNEER